MAVDQATPSQALDTKTPPVGITLTGLVISGQAKPDADVPLRAGLNVIVGASDTGKSHILEHIDHVLGAGAPPKRFPENEGYTATFLGVKGRTSTEQTLRRAIDGGDLLLFPAAVNARDGVGSSRTLGAEHDAGSDLNVSSYLLNLIELKGKRLRKNARGETVSLSFRHLAHLCFVSEGDMFRSASPVLSANKPQNTSEAAAFSLLLTGRDGSSLVALPDPKIQKAKIQAQLDLVNTMIGEREANLQNLKISSDNARSELEKIDSRITESAATIAGLSSEITSVEQQRKGLFEQLRPIEARLTVLGELTARFRLLASHYQNDVERLEAMVEAGQAFASLEAGECPLCQTKLGDRSPSVQDLDLFAAACRIETLKIRSLQVDLDSTRSTMAAEQETLEGQRQELRAEVRRLNLRLEQVLEPQSRTSNDEFQQLLSSRAVRAQAAGFANELSDLKRRVVGFETSLKEKKPKAQSAIPDLVPFERFAQVVEELLRSWQYPGLQRVTFDTKGLDIVISGRARGSLGKGYRAITHAAFTIATMRFCRQVGLPHPGVVILDSPLVTLKPPDPQAATKGDQTPAPASDTPEATVKAASDTDEEIPLNMKDAFYTSLAKDKSGDQIIILENDEPPAAVDSIANVVHFTRVQGAGRYGLFPVNASAPA